ncbi:tryptophan 2,3-dioxygenase [Actinophytocola xinjiangensis]|uniref:Tryptophan 2,3-dioxygenase n=1 Tax=Actinophytocola xinjiangensis TaxID=485602 RepID=A0A7Z1B1E4_9PSEU|nr:tryptophan 2,3-dioxygenase family protein [Actinophytocola xinjiangensis]OLF14111.1 tryptophan 2,3-dioxygenase [Actinophytocola xinjiangensis]
MCTHELRHWLRSPQLRTFPFDQVVRHFHEVGKHFVAAELLDLLARARQLLPSLPGPWPQLRTLASFLDTALDKPDGRYDYGTYLGLSLLQVPHVDDPVEQAPFARTRCDRLSAQLLADALAFELVAAEEGATLLPAMRPAPDLVTKRHKHGLRVLRPILVRMNLERALTGTAPEELARQAADAVHADMSMTEQRAIQLSVLPVYTAHDEYLFLRVLQTFETTFALLAVQLRAVIAAFAERRVDEAVHFLSVSATALSESAPLFSMLATMQVESFRTFRQFTEGASAIQSTSYKILESLCRRPDEDRLDSPAYHSVPPVRQRVLDGQATLDDAYREAVDSGDLDPRDHDRLAEAMSSFAHGLLRWRNTHYRLAVRMLGEASGTGYTQGTPYLNAVRDIPVFRTVTDTENTARTS